MSLVQAKAWIALQNRLAQWTECKVMLPDEIYQSEADTPFIIAQDVGLDYDDDVFGYGCGAEYRGVLNLSVMVPLSTWSYAQQKGLASRIAAHFTYGGRFNYQGVSVEIFQPPRIIGNVSRDGPHNRLEVQVNWRAWG